MESGMTPAQETRVWDRPTRLFHWSLVLLIALQYASGEFGWLSMEWHFRLGYATLALVVFRVLWGMAGSQTARFGSFVRGPFSVARYLADLARGRAAHAQGHNPLGGWSVLAMLASVALQAVSGLFTSDDIFDEGPLVARASSAVVEWMGWLHHMNRYVLLAPIALHVLAVLMHALVRNENLVAPMLHGRARHASGAGLRFVSSWRALLLVAISAALVWALIEWGAAA